jgi:hypothetical protein
VDGYQQLGQPERWFDERKHGQVGGTYTDE